jgi:hypothetical protein
LLNPDVFAGPTHGGTEEQKTSDEMLIENAAAFLLEALIPNMVQNIFEISNTVDRYKNLQPLYQFQ